MQMMLDIRTPQRLGTRRELTSAVDVAIDIPPLGDQNSGLPLITMPVPISTATAPSECAARRNEISPPNVYSGGLSAASSVAHGITPGTSHLFHISSTLL